MKNVVLAVAYPEVKDTLEIGLRDLMDSIAAGAYKA